MMEIYDISLPISPRLAPWPGDDPYRLTWTCTKSSGSTVNLGAVSMSVHTGSHADAPFHFDQSGASIDLVPLDIFVGPAVVIDVRGLAKISRTNLDPAEIKQAPRVLLKTTAWTDHSTFPGNIPVMDPDVPSYLHDHGVFLIGVDLPSVDEIESKELPNHHALHEHGIQILESLMFQHVPEGVYELIALPLRLEGVDGSPLRAILRR